MTPLSFVTVFILVVGSAMASEMVSRIVVPLSKLMKYSEAAGACEHEGMRLVRFSSEKESIEYATATLVEKNLDRVWIGAVGEDERDRLALEVFEGKPVTFKIEQIYDEEKMLAVLCEPVFMTVQTEPITNLDEDLKELAIETTEQADEKSVVSVEQGITEVIKTEEVVICKFEVDPIDQSVQIMGEETMFEDIDLIKSKGHGHNTCSRSRRSCSSSSSSSSSSCERPRRQYGYRGKRRNHRGYRRNRRSGSGCSRRSRSCTSSSSSSSSSSSCSSSSSSECAGSDYSCDPCERSSSNSDRKCRRFKRHGRKSQRKSRRSNRNRRSGCSSSSSSSSCSSSSSSSSSRESCGTGRCGSVRGEGKFFREIRLSQRIH